MTEEEFIEKFRDLVHSYLHTRKQADDVCYNETIEINDIGISVEVIIEEAYRKQ